MIKMRDILRKILIVIFALFIAMPGFAANPDDNNVGDFGSWATPYNRTLVVNSINNDLQNFAPPATDAAVPIEAKIGLAFMGGLSKVGVILDSSLGQFAVMFILLMYAFWVAFEAYNLIGTGADAKDTVKKILIKGLIIAGWLIVLRFGIAKTFALIMVPIVSIGTFISNTIWDGITSAAGYHVPDYCKAITDYATANISGTLSSAGAISTNTVQGLNITAESAAGLLCVPSQMSNFFWTIIRIGWSWVTSNVGVSLFGVAIGLYITYLGLKGIWKFLFIALGVIADLFLSLLMLPFTAIAETTAKTNYKGIAGDIFNAFLGVFKAEKLEVQINRMVKAALYFVCLSVAIGVSIALLTFVINPTNGQINPDMQMDGLGGVIILVLTLLLVCYMADKSKELADKWGGKIDSGLGDSVQKDVKNLWNLSKKRWETLRKLGKK